MVDKIMEERERKSDEEEEGYSRTLDTDTMSVASNIAQSFQSLPLYRTPIEKPKVSKIVTKSSSKKKSKK